MSINTLRKGEVISISMKAGEQIKIACDGGGQLADLVFQEFHQGLTLDRLGRFVLREGDLLFNAKEEPVLKVLRIASKANSNIVYPGCRSSLYSNRKQGCRELLASALNVPVEALPGTINLFMDFEIDARSYEFRPAATRAKDGDFVELEALADVEIAIAACPCEELSEVEGKIAVFASRVRVNGKRCARFAAAIKCLDFHADDFTDPLLFPPVNAPPEVVASYFFFMVAIDHRTSANARSKKKFEGIVSGKMLHGSDLLYALARARQKLEPDFFTAEKMQHISKKEVAEWLSPGEASIPDPEVRAMLLRDCGKKLLKHHGGSALELIKAADGCLIHEDRKGLLQLLAKFKAYEDPLSKKSYLLVKFLERRKLFWVKDPKNLHIPVDSVLARIALRTGIIEVRDKELQDKLKKGLPASESDDREIRSAAQKAYDLVSRKSGLGVTVLDDILWTMGRACCSRDKPVCLNCEVENCRASQLLSINCKHKCVFMNGCRGVKDLRYRACMEPNFKTWYY